MTKSISSEQWRGLGVWNLYFIFKFALLYANYLNFHPLHNLAFMAFLLMPISSVFLSKLRHGLALVIGISLFYYDTWLPSVYSVYAQFDQVADFSFVYCIELLNRFINVSMLLMGFVLWIGYLFINQWVRVTSFVVISMILITLLSVKSPDNDISIPANLISSVSNGVESKSKSKSKFTGSLTSQINQFTDEFWLKENKKRSPFSTLSMNQVMPFDVLFIHVCSLSWHDVKSVHLDKHPLWKKFDVMFDKFNSAASYSNPAALRLLRGSCGQPKFPSLFEPTSSDCYLMKTFSGLGFKKQWMLDHSGVYGNMLDDLKENGGLSDVSLMSQAQLSIKMKAFYGGEIFDDKQLLDRWMNGLKQASGSVTFFNTIALHDGNRSISTNTVIAYQSAVKDLLDTVDNLLDKLNASGKKTMVVFIGAHGRNYAGDAIQMAGLRDIPSPEITQVPVAIKFTGLTHEENEQFQTIHIQKPSSFYALSEIIAQVIHLNFFEKGLLSNVSLLLNNLSVTPMVSQNQGASVVNYDNQTFIKLRNEYDWIKLPKTHRSVFSSD